MYACAVRLRALSSCPAWNQGNVGFSYTCRTRMTNGGHAFRSSELFRCAFQTDQQPPLPVLPKRYQLIERILVAVDNEWAPQRLRDTTSTCQLCIFIRPRSTFQKRVAINMDVCIMYYVFDLSHPILMLFVITSDFRSHDQIGAIPG